MTTLVQSHRFCAYNELAKDDMLLEVLNFNIHHVLHLKPLVDRMVRERWANQRSYSKAVATLSHATTPGRAKPASPTSALGTLVLIH